MFPSIVTCSMFTTMCGQVVGTLAKIVVSSSVNITTGKEVC